MKRDSENRGAAHRIEAFKEALYADVHQGPARLSLERRRLLAKISRAESERGGIARRRLGRVWLAAALSAAASVAALLAVVVIRGGADHEEVAPLELTGLWRLETGDALSQGGALTVPASEGAKILWPDHTAFWIGQRSEMAFSAGDINAPHLSEGRLLATVSPREKSASFRVGTPAGVVVVHGTVFSVSVAEDGVRVRLHEGRVTFDGKAGRVRLEPHSELFVAPGAAPVVSPIDDAGVLKDLMIAERTSGLAGPPVPDLGRYIAMPTMDVVVRPKDPKDAEDPRPLDRKMARRGERRASRPATDLAAPPLADEPTLALPERDVNDPTLEDIEVVHRQAQSAVPRIEALIRERRYAEGIAVADEYLKHQKVAEDADRVLYLRGYCEMRRGNLKAGREAFETYLIQFPKGRHWERVQDILSD
jgi:hypothetical protein